MARYEQQRAGGVHGTASGLTVAELWQAVTALAVRLWEGEQYLELADLAELAETLSAMSEAQLTPHQTLHTVGACSLLVRTEDGQLGMIHGGAAQRGAGRGAAGRGEADRLPRADLRDAVVTGSRWRGAALIDVTARAEFFAATELHGAAIAPGQPVHAQFAPAAVGVSYGFEIGGLPAPVDYSGDGQTLAIGSDDGGGLLCDTASGLPLRTLHGPSRAGLRGGLRSPGTACWRPPRVTARSACGTRRRETGCIASRGAGTGCGRWRSTVPAAYWPPATAAAPCGCGTPRPERCATSCPGTTAANSPAQETTAPSGSEISPAARLPRSG